MIYDCTGHPSPPSEIVRRLRQVNPRLDLKWQPRWSGGYHWALVMDWQENDLRHKYVQRGEMDPNDTFDLLVHLPADCSADEAFGYLERSCRSTGQVDFKQMLGRLQQFNADVKTKHWDEVLDPAREIAETRAHKLFTDSRGDIPKSFPTVAPRTRGKTAQELSA